MSFWCSRKHGERKSELSWRRWLGTCLDLHCLSRVCRFKIFVVAFLFAKTHKNAFFFFIYLRFLNVCSMSACSGESCIAKCGQCYHVCMMHMCMLQSIIQSFWIEHKTAPNCFYLYLIQIQVCTLGIIFSVSNTVLINTVLKKRK